jgi:1,4-dihydroxy-2-naphthoate octaprenyltransferase
MKFWILAARPKTLPASLSPVLLGLAAAKFDGAQISIHIALLTALSALMLQVSSNLINDYYDAIEGVDNEDRLGPQRMTSTGKISPTSMKKGFIITLMVSLALGCYLMAHGGLPIIITGISSLIFCYAYTGGPFPLSRMGLGELLAFIFFGPVAVMGTYYLQTMQMTFGPLIILCGVYAGLLSAMIMSINNVRDYKTDQQTNKFTLPIALGPKLGPKLPLLFLVSSVLVLVKMAIDIQVYQILIAPVALLVVGKMLKPALTGVEGRILNESLAASGKYLFLTSLIISGVLLWSKT